MNNRRRRNISFLNFRKPVKINSFLTHRMTPSPLFKKESILNKNKKLKPWGDADLDGTPNKFDCDPFRADKDAKKLTKKAGGLIRGLGMTLGVLSTTKKGNIAQKISKGTGAYSKESKRAQKRFSGRVLGAVRLLTPAGTISAPSKTAGGKGRRGRPAGPSGRYYIPGVGAVGVYEYRTWLRDQKRLARLRGKDTAQRMPVQRLPQTQVNNRYTEQISEEDVNMEELDNIEQPQVTEQPMEQRQPLTERVTASVPETADNMKAIQLQMQMRDNILLAPQFMKGELKNTSTGSIIDERGKPTILNAPNAFRGELRNLQPRTPVELGQAPISNPRGEYFTTIDPITGNPIIQRRVSEKWLTGEAI